MFGITLNKPATGSFFSEIGTDKAGIRVRILPNKTVQFMPVANLKTHEAIPLEPRTRGGLAGIIEGLQATELLQALNNPNGNRFFTCSPTPEGWITLQPAKKQPSRFTPHFRLWLKDNEDLNIVDGPIVRKPSRILDEVRQAKIIIRDFEESRDAKTQKAGRPPREVTEAKEKLRDIAEAAREVLPVDTIRHACSVLVAYLDGTGRDSFQPPETERRPYAGRTDHTYQRRKVSRSSSRVDSWTAELANEAASKLGFLSPA